ncbi:sugar-binding domain protein [Gardnerella vaginalis 1500E]|uniref:Sugar-binding domain protein n=1 Tax=Gardnerella vaginalis 1500E TaxID=698957 RepID=I4M2Z0_GARVA|nr:GA module-containing protein [Gardnerella vaginalis]EIK83580.1 sugar-binding domain protein [Gardnerella vaginalis 1500E]
MKKNNINANSFADLLKSAKSTSYAPLSKSVCAAMLAGAMVLGGGVFVSPAPAYADGYVSPDGNNIYYGYKSDADYSKDRIKIEVHYYSNMKDAEEDNIAKQDPLGKYVHVKYIANLNKDGNTFDRWAFRPMWWYGVPAGLTDVHDINYSRFEKYTDTSASAPSTPGIRKDSDNVTKHYANSKDWKGISNFYITDPSKLTSMNGLKTLLGIDGGNNKGYDNKGDTAGNWTEFYDATKGMQGMFVDWESAGKRYYQMTYVAELTEQAWQQRDEHPLRFGAGVYRFAGNWHIATGQIHRAPKIADSLKVKYPTQTPVANVNSLTTEEQNKVKTAINDANNKTPHFKDLLDGTAGIKVDADGTATLKFKDNTTLVMPGKLLVVEDKKDNVKFPPAYPAPIGVVNPKSLSDADQKAIIEGFKKANTGKEFLNKVKDQDADAYTFDNNKQELTINYKDGSSLTIPYDQLVYQGPKIADWAPYSVPDMITVDNLTNITDTEVTTIKKAFDDANSGLDVYTNAKTKDSTGYLTIDKKTGNATIKWEDGSTTEIASWQFLKEKEKTAPAPEPSTPVAEEKTFTVDAQASQIQVNFNPFSMAESDLTTNSAQIDPIKDVLKAKKGKDSKNPNTQVNIDSVEYSVENGIGYITFKANGYKDAKYPMGMFFKQRPDKQTPKETEHNPQGKDQYKYKVQPVEYEGNSVTPQDWMKALKQFVKSNYGKDLTSDSAVVETYVLPEGITPVEGTKGLQRFVKGKNGDNGVTTIHVGNDGVLEVQGYENGDNNLKTLFTVPASELYVKKNASGVDHTVSDLKDLAKKIRDAKKASGVTDIDFKRAGIDDASDNTINGMNEKQLRELIAKLTNATKAEYIYTASPIEIDRDPNASDFAATDDEVQAAVKAFLKANYTGEGIDSYTITGNSGNFDNITWTPKSGTKNLELKSTSNPAGIDSFTLNYDDAKSVNFKNGDTVLFNVPATELYKKKEASKPAPSAEDLKKLKEQAKELIDRNPKLTDAQKKDYKKKIEDATTKEQIQNILKEANNQSAASTVTPEQLKQKEKREKEKREKEQREKEQKKQLGEDKTKAKETIEGLTNLTDGDSGDKKKLSGEIDNAQTSEEVKNIIEKAKAINDARGALKEGALPFLSHGKGESDNDDKALKELIGADPTQKDSTLTALENAIKDISSAQTSAIRAAIDAATRQNGINEQAARQAANAKIAEFENKLTAAEKVLTDNTTIKADDKTAATNAINEAKAAITTAKTRIDNATKPSEMLTHFTDVKDKFNTANGKVNDAVNNAQKENKKGNTNDPDATTFQSEKDKAKKEIDNIPGLTEEEKTEYKKQIDQSTHTGDPEAIVNRAKKNDKIKKALKKIDDFKHLNNAQKEAFKKIIEDTDASDHKNADGTTSDDIDDALANAANTDNAMARLEELKTKADEFAKGEKYKALQDGNEQKKAFDDASTASGAVLDKVKGDAKGADEVNTLYDDLLKAMRAIDPNAQSAGLKTDALKAEIASDETFKPDTTANPAKPGNPVYNTSSKAKKDEFDKALGEAKTVLNGAGNADISTADKEATEQKEIDAALDKLVKARLALDGVDTTKLQTEIGNAPTVEESDAYKFATNKSDYDTALKDAKELIDKLTGKKQASADDHLDTKENKQTALDAALKKLQDAAKALDGKKPVEPTPTPTPSVDKSHLQQGINDGSDVHNSDEYNNAPSDKKQAYDHALDHANEVNNDPNATQDQVNQATEDLKKAEHDLKPAPTPSPVPGGAGFGVNDNASTTVDKGELNIQIDSAEADSQPGNAGNGNAGNAGNTNAANAANSAAVNAAVENSPAVKQADAQVAKAQAALDSALAEAKKVAADPNATQAQVDAAAQKLSAARKALAAAKAHAAQVRASVRAQVLKSGVSQLSKTGSNVSVIGLLATVAAAGAAFFVSKRRGISRHSNN